MALPSVDRNGGESTAVDAPRLNPTPFLSKTYQLVDDRDIDDVISWNADGSAFVVWNTAVFAGDLLPKYFKHNNFSSFIRQLNTYGFRKVVPDRWEFSNDCFRRGDKKLLCDIQRRKIAAATPPTPSPPPQTVSPSESGENQVTSSSISPSSIFSFGDGTAELIGENKRLKKENLQLNKELSQMKSLCDNIYVLMSSFSGDGDRSTAAMKPLDLLPMTRFHDEMAAADGGGGTGGNSPGGPMCGKRGRESEGTPAEYGMDLQLQLPVGEIKSEPLDQEERLKNSIISCNGCSGD